MNLRHLFLAGGVAFITLGLGACGGGGSEEGGGAAAGTTFTVTPSLGVVTNATVRLYQSDGSTLLGTGDSGADGVVEIRYGGSYRGPVVVTVLGDDDARYFDEASGSLAPFGTGKVLRAIAPSGTTRVGVTMLTEIAYRLSAEHSIGLTDATVNQLNDRVRRALAPELASILTPPTPFDASTSSGSLDDSEAGRYALRLAALAQLGAGDATPALTVAEQLARDMADGTLDGQSGGSAITGLVYDSATFASDLAGHLGSEGSRYGSSALQAAVAGYGPISTTIDVADLGTGTTGGSTLTPSGDGAALAGGNGATGTVGGTAYTFQGHPVPGSAFYAYVPTTDVGMFSAYDGTSATTRWSINGFPAAVGSYNCGSGGELPSIMLLLDGTPYLARQCVIEIISVSTTEVEGRFAATDLSSGANNLGSVSDGYFRYSAQGSSGQTSQATYDFGDEPGLPMLDKAVGSYSAYVWESSHPDIPTGPFTFDISRVGDQGRVEFSGISVVTNESPSQLTDTLAAGFLKFLGDWRFVFQDATQGGGSPNFLVNITAGGGIAGSYRDDRGAIQFTNSENEIYSKEVPQALIDLAGEYSASGFFFVSGPLDFNIYADGTVSYTDPNSCTVKSIQWDGNADMISSSSGLQTFRLSDPGDVNEINFFVDGRGLWEFRIGSAVSTEIYRIERGKPGNPTGELTGERGLSLCTARNNDTTPPVITLPADLTVQTSDPAGYARDGAIEGYLNGAKAEDVLTTGYGDFTENVTVRHDLTLTTLPVGDTVVTFTATDGQGNTATALGRITVVHADTEAPVVTAPADITVAATDASGTARTDGAIAAFLASASATDNADGSVGVTALNVPDSFPLGTTTITFEAVDAAGNRGSASATVTVVDQDPPVITLTGDDPLTVTRNATYVEQGATAVDNVDGSIATSAIEIDTSGLDMATAGLYTVTYTATDAAGNRASVTRTVEVVAPKGFSVTMKNPYPTHNTLNKVVFGNEFVAVGEKGAIVTSSDGVTWQAQSSGTSENIKDICWDGSQYVALTSSTIGEAGVLFSSDAASWRAAQTTGLSGSIYPYELACKPGRFVIRTITSRLYHSTNGTDWQQAATTISGMRSLNLVNGQFVAQSFQAIQVSDDGVNWVEKTAVNGVYDLTWDGGQYVLVGSYYDSATYSTKPVGTTSNDLVSYTDFTPPTLGMSIEYLNSSYLLLGTQFGDLHLSSDLTAWSRPDAFASVNLVLRSAAWNGDGANPVYVVVGDGGTIYSSTDLAAWTARNGSVTSSELFQSAYDPNGKVAVAVGRSGTIVRSTNLDDWSVVTSGVATDLNAVVYGDQFVAVGARGIIVTSPDGLNWTRRTSESALNLTAIAWNGGEYLAVSDSKTVFISSDGVTWSSNTNGGFLRLWEVLWDGSQWLVHDARSLWTSADGVNWTQHGGVGGSGIAAMAWDGTYYWAARLTGGALFKNTLPSGLVYTGTNVGANPTDLLWDGDANRFLVTKQQRYTTDPVGIMTSPDGVNWTEQGDNSLTFHDVQKAGNAYIFVGKGGIIAVGQ